MAHAHPIASVVAAAVAGALLGLLAAVITGEAFWVGMGAAVAVTFWIAAGLITRDHAPHRRDEGRLSRGLPVAAGMAAGVSLFAATGQPLWIGIGLSTGLLVYAFLELRRGRSSTPPR
ncbi:MAG: hypothetical protein AB7L91_15780 [Dehalococcoidia bacterium]